MVTVAGVAGTGAGTSTEMVLPGVVLFIPSYSIDEAGQAARANRALLMEETMATGEAAR